MLRFFVLSILINKICIDIASAKNLILVGKDKKATLTPYNSLQTPQIQQCFSKCHYDKQCYSMEIIQTTLYHCNYFNQFARQASLTSETNSNVFSEIRSCQDLADMGTKNTGVYEINLLGEEKRRVRCHFDADGAWLVFQRHVDAKTNFSVGWQSYKHGFGDPQGNFF